MTNEKILYAEICVLGVITMLLLSRKLRRYDKSIEQFYLSGLLSSLALMFLFDAFWVLIDGIASVSPILNYVINILYFVTTAVCPFFTVCYLRMTVTGTAFTKKQHLLLNLPAIAILIADCTTVFNGAFFSVDSSNTYHRGPLYYFQYMIPLLYMLAAAGVALYYGLHTQRPEKRGVAFKLMVLMIIPVAGSLLEILFPKVSIICGFITVTMISIIFDFQQERITKDTLTHLSNRYDLTLYLQDQLEMPVLPDGQMLYVMFADIDRFKNINDTYGHLEGDRALCCVAEALRTVSRSANAYPARIGGDEFVLVFRSDSDRGASAFRQVLKQTVENMGKGKPYRLSISAGYTRAEASDRQNPAGLLDRADGKLYEQKQNRPSAEEIVSGGTANNSAS